MSARISNSKFPEHKSLDAAEVYLRATRFCAYQERSHHEVRKKLHSLGLRNDGLDEVLSRLITDGFVNEERFAKAFSGGKFRIKNWGRLKIEQALSQHDITPRCIALGLREIDEDDYRAALKKLIHKKSDSLDETNIYQRRDAISKYVIAKGFEPELVWEILREEIPDSGRRMPDSGT